MSNNDIIVSLDIGTSKVRAIIGEVVNGTINIIGVGSAESEGIRKGAIVDIDQTVNSIRSAVDHAERMVGVQISEVYVGISGNHIALQSSHGVVAVSNEDREIGEEDIDRVIQAARVIALPPEREIIGVVPKQYLVDGQEGINDPRGMIGVRLEVEATIITGAKTGIHNLIRVVEKSELKVAGLILMSLASGQLALSKDEKSVGTVLVDVGAGAATIAVFEQGNLTATSTIQIGGEYISNDISIGLRTQLEIAEKIKLKYGCASVDDSAPDQMFKVTRMGSNVEKEFSQVDLANIIEPRVEEIFQMIRAEVHRLGYGDLAGGYVLTGGTVCMPGVLAIAQAQLATSVRIAVPDFIGVRDPSYTSGVGIIQFVSKYMKNRNTAFTKKVASKPVTKKSSESSKPGILERVKSFFSEFI
ncbi:MULTISPECIES: cell division protein FtsA [Paenibacillus]|uniref:Cell division protein FtsA n=3 Tax=Paenibacillus TaxID=44249 RepID=A0ABU3RCR1_9BACL|nr:MULTISPECIES: cell division protein FtsA [Paenibacillus]MBA2938074.1 cell division protein FtsA [Paenibacillus sp. CGMCC 1.16610]MCY9658362.1 cell division protein FtsA [Paenibacillus anseongense]MDU0201612.1 cell division protein FtsA [Paenibacillus sp. PFR10]MEB4792639.1 cell division protein FtsA [Paenibacillus chondroitinus]MEC0265617.1 cell division protein FtsA [Paenibacillus anseongense]